ncbi:hypothetical protein B0T13DRAFT_448543 [Neurospora crassa]|nr:hypothetical protein B0T13DRAFT_448543 [Neurospora crassa]
MAYWHTTKKTKFSGRKCKSAGVVLAALSAMTGGEERERGSVTAAVFVGGAVVVVAVVGVGNGAGVVEVGVGLGGCTANKPMLDSEECLVIVWRKDEGSADGEKWVGVVGLSEQRDPSSK